MSAQRSRVQNNVLSAAVNAARRPPLTREEVLRGRTLREVSAGAGVSLGYLCGILNGKHTPSFAVGLRLSAYLGRDPFELAAYLGARRAEWLAKYQGATPRP